ncbi:hypothetical protein GcM1_244130 [Golovinomyces cichoracearum]|uniref:Uncharacterized protein n=1 Tax=Golovinomyces cichoracearum TaxID=62708 RepID=A0A420IG17_9PEZI|nr:hypothetical protein GcM1_244130 [Golovinomyces cichoracearum]
MKGKAKLALKIIVVVEQVILHLIQYIHKKIRQRSYERISSSRKDATIEAFQQFLTRFEGIECWLEDKSVIEIYQLMTEMEFENSEKSDS